MNNFSIGTRVIISPEAYDTLTVEAVRNFRISGGTKLRGTIVNNEWGGNRIAVAIDNGIELGFGHAGSTNGINIVRKEYLIFDYNRKSIYEEELE